MQWAAISTMLSPRAWSGVGILGNHLFVVGGFDGVNRLSSVEMYNAETNRWKHVANMSFARAGCGVAVL